MLHWSGHLTGEVLVCHVVDLPAISNFDLGSVVVWLVDTSAVFRFVLGLVPVGVLFFGCRRAPTGFGGFGKVKYVRTPSIYVWSCPAVSRGCVVSS